MDNSRFTVAIHVLCLLAHSEAGSAVTSDYIAGSVNTNPVVIRRLLRVLREAGVLKSQPGGSGGWELIADARTLTLLQIYRLVTPGSLFAMHPKAPNPRCAIGKNIQASLRGFYRQAETALERELQTITITDVLERTMRASAKKAVK